MRAADPPETAARAALATHDATRALAGAKFEPIRGGLSNYAWKAEQHGRSWFVRLGGPESATLGVDRWSERALLAVADSAGLAPSLVACEPSSGLLVTRFIAGAPWRREDARDLRNVERLSERLRVLHGLEPPNSIRKVDFEVQARSLDTQLHALGVVPGASSEASGGANDAIEFAPATGPAIRLLAASAFERLASRPRRLALCHNDLHHLNLLDGGDRLWIVDWEYGGVGDPVFDLASFACQHEYTAVERAALLGAYGHDAGIPMSVLDAACIVFDYVQWLWYLLWAARNPDANQQYSSRARALAGRLVAAGP
jgi:thiamine kinase-like enzyme